MASGITVPTGGVQSNLVAGIMDNSTISKLEYMELSATVRKLSTLNPEHDTKVYHDYGVYRTGTIDAMKAAGRVIDLESNTFTTFTATAPYKQLKLADVGTSVGIAAQATPGGNITFKIEATAYINTQDPLKVGQDIHIPVVYTKVGGVAISSPVPFQIISRTSTVGSSATVWTAKPYDATVTVDAVPVGAFINPQGFGATYGGKPKGGFTNTKKQQSWNTSLRTWRYDFEEGTILREEIFEQVPSEMFKMIGLPSYERVRLINPNMRSIVGQDILLNEMLFQKDLEQTFLIGAKNSNSVTDAKEDGSTGNIQAGKGMITSLDEQGISMKRTGAIEVSDFISFEKALRNKGFSGHEVDIYAAPDANMEIATAWQTYVKDYNPDGIATGMSFTIKPTIYQFGAFRANLYLIDSWGDAASLGAEGYGLNNRIIVIPKEESSAMVGDSVLQLPNAALLRRRANGYDRSYMVKVFNGFTEVEQPAIKDWGNCSIGWKAEIGFCGPTLTRVINCPRS